MRKSSILILLMFVCLAGCKSTVDDKVTIAGEIKGLGTDTLYLYGTDENYDRIDTIFVSDDRFSFTTKVDTATTVSAYLLLKNETEYPLFLETGNHIRIEGDTCCLRSLTVDGNVYNNEYTAFRKETENLSDSVAAEKAEEFITLHHSSFVSLYLLDTYFVRKDAPDFERIKKLTTLMAGVLQDTPYIEQLNDAISKAEKVKKGRYAPYFTLPNAKGEKMTRSSESLRQKALLLHFWASWGDSIANKESNRELRALYKKYKKNKHVAILGISLDMDKQQWKDAVKRDTLDWEQVCDFGGLNSEVAKQYTIRTLPMNLLLSPDGRILAIDIRGEELKKEVEKLVGEAERKEKEKEKEKKKRK